MNSNHTKTIHETEVNNPLSVMQDGEEVVCEIRRHPIGLIAIKGSIATVLLFIGLFVFAVAPAIFASYDRTQVMYIDGLVFLIALAIGIGAIFVYDKVYSGNRWIVTSDSITQIIQTSLFDTQSSQLSMLDLEDIGVEQNGLLTQMFNYGVLSAESAGTKDKFTFIYCPQPNDFAKKILNAREHFERTKHLKGQFEYSGNAPANQHSQPRASINQEIAHVGAFATEKTDYSEPD